MNEHQELSEPRRDDVRDLIDTNGHWLDFEVVGDLPADQPPDRLVRFVPLEQYLALLTTQQIYFPRASEYEDPLECRFPEEFCIGLSEALLENVDEPEFALPPEVDRTPYISECWDLLRERVWDELHYEERDRWFVSCWHAGDVDTDLMWRSYGGHKGVAISCEGISLPDQFEHTISVSRNALACGKKRDHFDFLHGHVEYEPEVPAIDTRSGAPVVTVRPSAFRKNKYFRLDAEYRFAARLHAKDTAHYAASAKLDLSKCGATISTSPFCPRWIADAIANLTSQYYPSIPFHKLSLE